ncbi:hypothetical protein NIES2104_30760 [Leptolyngbya sp. NIES-2104]|nr:hypothetical protein NIES2104_30760 [Leptolyngbya sp. NIES-2104]
MIQRGKRVGTERSGVSSSVTTGKQGGIRSACVTLSADCTTAGDASG